MTGHFVQGSIALIDDDEHSVRLLTRALVAEGASDVVWLGDGMAAHQRLETAIALGEPLPGLVLVDLKAYSHAGLDFIGASAALRTRSGLMMAAMIADAAYPAREAYLAAGAAAVFVRHGDRDAYRREAKNIVSFVGRTPSLMAVGM